MLIDSNYLYIVTDINYDTTRLVSNCKLSKYTHSNEFVSSEILSWKGSDFFLTEENLSVSNVLTVIYEYLIDTLDNVNWKYNPIEDVIIPKIYKYIKNGVRLKHFHDIDYTLELDNKLYPKRTFVKGELQSVEWHSNSECTDAIIRVDTAYTRDALGFALNRQTTRAWYNTNGQLNNRKKVTNKSYTINSIDQTSEGVRRRGNIIRGLQMPILGLMINTISDMTDMDIIEMGRDFLKLYKLSFQSFIDESHKGILSDIANATDYWLDNIINANGTTIRQYILNELDISI